MLDDVKVQKHEKAFVSLSLKEIFKPFIKICASIFSVILPYLLVLSAIAGFCYAVFQIINPWNFNPFDIFNKFNSFSMSEWQKFINGDISMFSEMGSTDYQSALIGLANGLDKIDHGKKTNRGLAQFARNAADVRCGYVWGWHGQEITAASMEKWQHSSIAQSEEACSSDKQVQVTLRAYP